MVLGAAVRAGLSVRRGVGVWSLAVGLAIGGGLVSRASRSQAAESVGGARLLGRSFGIRAVRELMASSVPGDLVRAVRRLLSLATPEAFEALSQLVAERGADLSSAAWLLMTRGLAPHASQPVVARLLTDVVERGTPVAIRAEADDLVRGVAALALAATGRQQPLAALVRSLDGSPPAARAARAALLAYPPRRARALLQPRAATVAWVQLLADLGDQRTFHELRDFVRAEGPSRVRAEAALALTRLGALETVGLARHWSSSEDEVLRRAALEILLLAGEPAVAQPIAAAFQRRGEKRWLRQLVLRHPRVDLLPWLPEHSPQRPAWLAAAGGPEAFGSLRRELDGEWAWEAARALSLVEGEAAEEMLSGWQVRHDAERGSRRWLGVGRARVVWAWRHVRPPPFDGARLRQWAQSSGYALRAFAGFAAALDGGELLGELLDSGDEAVRVGLSQAALLLPSAMHRRAAGLLARSSVEECGVLAFSLLRPEVAATLPTVALRRLLGGCPAARPLVARALAMRVAEPSLSLIRGLLADRDSLIRAHVVDGLGHARGSWPAVLLTERFGQEHQVTVRRALARALPVASARRQLSSLARFDPDPAVRASARAALGGAEAESAVAGSEFLWLRLDGPSAPGGSDTLRPLGGRLADDPGPCVWLSLRAGAALPLCGLVASEGAAVAGLPPGEFESRLVRHDALEF